MAEDRESFLRRWSRRKLDTGPAAEPPTAEQMPAAAGPLAPTDQAGEAEPFDVASLPDIETLDAGSDFKAFLRKGVPQELRTLALRKLWRLDPTYAHLDGLVDYGEDFRATNLVGKLKTAYQVGKGFARHEDEAAHAAAPEGATLADPQPPPEPAPDHGDDDPATPPPQIEEVSDGQIPGVGLVDDEPGGQTVQDTPRAGRT